jgi:hypothetical protein
VIKGNLGGINAFDPRKIVVFTVINQQDVYSKIGRLGVENIMVKGLRDLSVLKDCIDKIL